MHYKWRPEQNNHAQANGYKLCTSPPLLYNFLHQREEQIREQQARNKPRSTIMADREQCRKHSLQSKQFNRQKHQILERTFGAQAKHIHDRNQVIQRDDSNQPFQVIILERVHLEKFASLISAEQNESGQHKESGHENCAHRDKACQGAKAATVMNVTMEQQHHDCRHYPEQVQPRHALRNFLFVNNHTTKL